MTTTSPGNAGPNPHRQSGATLPRGYRLGLVLCVLGAAALRMAAFPARYVVRDIDEPTYLRSGLLLFEGIAPGNSAAPAGPQLWAEWAYAAVRSLQNLAAPNPQERAAPLQVRPFLAIDRALFDTYHDLSELHRVMLVIIVLLSLWATCSAYRLGVHRGPACRERSFLAGLWAAAFPYSSRLFGDVAALRDGVVFRADRVGFCRHAPRETGIACGDLPRTVDFLAH